MYYLKEFKEKFENFEEVEKSEKFSRTMYTDGVKFYVFDEMDNGLICIDETKEGARKSLNSNVIIW